MSGEVGMVLVLPAVAIAGMLPGAGFMVARGIGALAGAAGDRLAERQTRTWAAADRLARVVAEHGLLRDQIELGRAQFGDLVTPPPALGAVPAVGAHLDRADSWAGQVEAMMAAAHAQFRQEMAASRNRRVMAEVAAALDRLPATTPTPGRPHRADAPAVSAQLAESVERVLARLDGGVPPPLADVLHKRAACALKARSETTQTQLLDDLRYSVDQANRQTQRRLAALRELAARLAGYTGPAIDAAQAAISAAVCEPEPDLPDLALTVDRAITATLAPMVGAYTRQALRESLAEIGCVVDADFDVALGRDGLAHLHRDGWEDLAVRVRSREEENAFYFNMIARAGADTDALAVEEVERQWCSAVDQLLPMLSEQGVQVVTTHRSEEGNPQVQTVAPARFPSERRRRDAHRRAEAQQHQRELPR